MSGRGGKYPETLLIFLSFFIRDGLLTPSPQNGSSMLQSGYRFAKKKYLDVDFSPDQVRMYLPPKRVLTLSYSVPMSKMTAILSEMEQNQLIGAKQRGEMWATPLGNRIIAGFLRRKYRKEAEVMLVPVVLKNLLQRLS